MNSAYIHIIEYYIKMRIYNINAIGINNNESKKYHIQPKKSSAKNIFCESIL